MKDFHDFFIASVGASAALIGLLFVAISIAPDRVFGTTADIQRRGQAIGAFVALANVFFVSLAATLPSLAPQTVIVVAAGAMVQIMRESSAIRRAFPERSGWRSFGLISLAIYLFELTAAFRILVAGETAQALAFTLMGLYSYALGTSWALLGARDAGVDPRTNHPN